MLEISSFMSASAHHFSLAPRSCRSGLRPYRGSASPSHWKIFRSSAQQDLLERPHGWYWVEAHVLTENGVRCSNGHVGIGHSRSRGLVTFQKTPSVSSAATEVESGDILICSS